MQPVNCFRWDISFSGEDNSDSVANDQNLAPLILGFAHLPKVLADSELGPRMAREHKWLISMEKLASAQEP